MPWNNLRSAIAQLTRGGRSVRSRDDVSDSNGSVGTVVAVGELSVILCQQYWLGIVPSFLGVLDYGRTVLRDIEERPGGKALAAELRDPRNWFFRR